MGAHLLSYGAVLAACLLAGLFRGDAFRLFDSHQNYLHLADSQLFDTQLTDSCLTDMRPLDRSATTAPVVDHVTSTVVLAMGESNLRTCAEDINLSDRAAALSLKSAQPITRRNIIFLDNTMCGEHLSALAVLLLERRLLLTCSSFPRLRHTCMGAIRVKPACVSSTLSLLHANHSIGAQAFCPATVTMVSKRCFYHLIAGHVVKSNFYRELQPHTAARWPNLISGSTPCNLLAKRHFQPIVRSTQRPTRPKSHFQSLARLISERVCLHQRNFPVMCTCLFSSSQIQDVRSIDIIVDERAQLVHTQRLKLKTQRAVLLAITKAYRTTFTEAIHVIAWEIPLNLQAMERRKLMQEAQGVSATKEMKTEARRETLLLWQERWDRSEKGRVAYDIIPYFIVSGRVNLSSTAGSLETGKIGEKSRKGKILDHGVYLGTMPSFTLSDSGKPRDCRTGRECKLDTPGCRAQRVCTAPHWSWQKHEGRVKPIPGYARSGFVGCDTMILPSPSYRPALVLRHPTFLGYGRRHHEYRRKLVGSQSLRGHQQRGLACETTANKCFCNVEERDGVMYDELDVTSRTWASGIFGKNSFSLSEFRGPVCAPGCEWSVSAVTEASEQGDMAPLQRDVPEVLKERRLTNRRAATAACITRTLCLLRARATAYNYHPPPYLRPPSGFDVNTASQKQSSDAHKTSYDRVKRCWGRKINIKASERVNVSVFAENKRPCPQDSTQPNPIFFFSAPPHHQRKPLQWWAESNISKNRIFCIRLLAGAVVVWWLDSSPSTMANQVRFPCPLPPFTADFPMWESCRKMSLSADFLGDLPFPPARAFRRCSILTRYTLIAGADSIAPRRNRRHASPSPLPGTMRSWPPDAPFWESRECRQRQDLLASQTSSRLLEFPIRLATTQKCSGDTGWRLSPPRRITRVGEDSRWRPKTLYILPQPSDRQSLTEAA
ncbi:hypothetical protein PR048_003438 [Dryococelus australis]|uniref:Uncharacterized protein n=1 Tax=Dryococelus australis TaxID=614101 RepID=A0ABQ9IN37_9NEOP|nr:hypothetical protein PR048_003438 [Dryococelus australis]